MITIESRKVAGVVIEAGRILADKGFNRAEVLIGLSELIGRMIVDAAENTIQADELYTACNTHIQKTIQIGIQAAQKSVIARV